MQSNIYTSFDEFIAQHEKDSSSIRQITSERVTNILFHLIVSQFPDSTAFSNEYFRQILHQVAETIMNVVYRKQQIFISIDQLVAYTNIIQFIIHSSSIQLPPAIKIKVEKYVYSLIVNQDCIKIKSIHEDSLNSSNISHFYKSLYINAFEFRYKQLMKQFGIIEKSIFLGLILVRDLIEKNQLNMESYESNVTSQWVTLSLIYFLLASKYEHMKQIPVLSKILDRYHSSQKEEFALRKINGGELCHFYNNYVIDKIKKTENYEVDKMVDEASIDHEAVANLIVSPILNENNTVLDNIIFSSSWEH